MSKVQIIPAILATTEQDYKETLQNIEDSKLFEEGWVQIDLMDNKFVQNQSVSPQIISEYSTKLNLEIHLMVEDPVEWISHLKANRVIAHLEIGEDKIESFIETAKKVGLEVGIAINPETEIKNLQPYLDQVDLVLIMSVNPGFQGQEFITDTVNRVKELVQLRGERKFLIEVDGGIGPDEAKMLADVGADCLAVGSHLVKGDIQENLENIWEKLQT